MIKEDNIKPPDHTALRTALWRALHKQVDAEPHILDDEIGLQLIAPEKGWQERPDMKYGHRLRASMVARARFIEDLIIAQSQQGITQYVLLGAGLDTFAERRPDIAAQLQIFEIDQPDTLNWKKERLQALNFPIPENLHFVQVDFEKGSWWEELVKTGFDTKKPAVVACTGVSLYLTEPANKANLSQLSALAPGSTLAMTFYLKLELLEEEDQKMQELGEKNAREKGTPMQSFYTREEILQLGKEAGFKEWSTISTQEMAYFDNRSDNLKPASGEVFLIAKT